MNEFLRRCLARFLVFLLPFLLLACASEPTNYYRLAVREAAPETPTKTLPTQEIIIEVRLPDYLNTDTIAYQKNDVSIVLAQNNRWVEAPEAAIAKALKTYFARTYPHINWLTSETAVATQGSRLLVSLDAFHGKSDGRALISGQWYWRTANQQLIATQAVHIEIPQRGNGYAALVRALSEGIEQLAAHMHSALSTSIERMPIAK